MNTEYLGIIYQIQNYCDELYYKSIKLNIEPLKLIQLEIIFVERGMFPYPYHTWPINF